MNNVIQITTDQVYDLITNFIYPCTRQVNLIEYGNDLQVMFKRQIEIGNGLSFDPLSSVNYQKGSFTRRNGSGNLIREIYVAGGINQIQRIVLTLFLIIHLYRMAFNRNSFLPLEVHAIQYLILHLTLRQS